jgi:hypothetical protein
MIPSSIDESISLMSFRIDVDRSSFEDRTDDRTETETTRFENYNTPHHLHVTATVPDGNQEDYKHAILAERKSHVSPADRNQVADALPGNMGRELGDFWVMHSSQHKWTEEDYMDAYLALCAVSSSLYREGNCS